MANCDKYAVYHDCSCDNKYNSKTPLCLGVLEAPEGQQSRKKYFWKIHRNLGVDVKDVAFIEVIPGKNVDTNCRGHQDKGYPIVYLKKGFKMVIVIQRLHKKTGDLEKDKNPACKSTHCVMMVLSNRQPSRKNRNPILEPYPILIKLFLPVCHILFFELDNY